MRVTRTVELPEGAAQHFASKARAEGLGVELYYPVRLGGMFAVKVTFEFELRLRGRHVDIVRVPA